MKWACPRIVFASFGGSILTVVSSKLDLSPLVYGCFGI